MATPWNNSTAYSIGAVVLYNGYEYVRSGYPTTATSGTPPNEEMSVDTYGVDIRTWRLKTSLSPGFRQVSGYYFRLDFPSPDNYAGLQFLQGNAYDYQNNPPSESDAGVTREYDQFTDNPSPSPDSPVCPSLKCGVAMQFDGIGAVNFTISTRPSAFGSRTYYVYLLFNHALYFRRTFTIEYETIATTTEKNPPEPPVSVITKHTQTYVPDDRNFADNVNNDYYVSGNSIFTIIIPPDEDSPDTSVSYGLYSDPRVTSISDND